MSSQMCAPERGYQGQHRRPELKPTAPPVQAGQPAWVTAPTRVNPLVDRKPAQVGEVTARIPVQRAAFTRMPMPLPSRGEPEPAVALSWRVAILRALPLPLRMRKRAAR